MVLSLRLVHLPWLESEQCTDRRMRRGLGRARELQLRALCIYAVGVRASTAAVRRVPLWNCIRLRFWPETMPIVLTQRRCGAFSNKYRLQLA